MGAASFAVSGGGGGPGGLATAALCTKWGLRTLVLEKNKSTGGKAVTVERDGFRYELGPKLQVPMRNPAFETLFGELGIGDKLGQILLDEACIAYRAREWDDYRIVVTPQSSGMDPQPFFDLWELEPTDQEKMIAVMGEMVMTTPEALDTLDDVTMADYLSTRDVPWRLQSYLSMHANASLAEPVDLVAASEQIKIMQQIAVSGGGGYYEGGFGRVLDDVAGAVRANGGEIRTGVRVEAIEVDGGHVTGVRTDTGAFTAPVVVSDAGIQPTVLKLVGEENFDPGYVEHVKGLQPGWGWASVRYFLSEPVMTERMYMVYADDSWLDLDRYRRVRGGAEPDEIIMFVTVPANFDPTMAPAGKQCLVTGTICSPDPDAAEIDMLYRKLDETLERLWPEAWAAVERRECDGPAEVSRHTRDHVLPGQGGECVGIGQIAGQCGTMKPAAQTPLPGLYLAGRAAGAAGMGTHQATVSGMAVAAMVREYLGATA